MKDELAKIETNPSPDLNVGKGVFDLKTDPHFQQSKELAELSTYGDERRQFNRADISDKKLDVHFADGAQFAKQYIENISVGGLFVKTDRKAKMGELMTIEFSIPRQDRPEENLVFSFNSRVCRVTPEGLGLEFINVSLENRRNLEEYVRAVLPKEMPVVAKPKATTVAHLEEQRRKKKEAQEQRRVIVGRSSFLLIMIGLNFWIASKSNENEIPSLKTSDIRTSMMLGDKKVEATEIRSMSLKDQTTVVITLNDGTSFQTSVGDIDKKAPPHILQSIRLLQTIEVPAPSRQSKNTGRLTRLR